MRTKLFLSVFAILLSPYAFSQASADSVLVDSVLVDSVSVSPAAIDSTNTAIDSLLAGKSERAISIIGVGDIMLGTSYPSERYLPPGKNCAPLLREVRCILQSADLTVGNLEGCFSNSAPLAKRCKDSTKCYAFRMPERFVFCLKEAGFDVLTIANNHSGDFGDLGRRTTVKLLDSVNIYHAGWIKYPVSVFTKDSVTYGIASFAPNRGTVSIHDTLYAKRLVKELRSKCDIVIATFHGGAEGSKYQHVTRKTERFYGENRGNVYQFAHAVINAGADVVFGHGPHVPRAIELYQNRFIAYSLGNFCTYGRFNLRGVNGLAPIVKIWVNTDGEFIRGEIFSARQPGAIGTVPDRNNTVAKLIKQLTEADFPESQLIIDNSGKITRKY